MKKTLFLIVILLSFGSCKSSKKAKNKKTSASKVVAKKPVTKDSKETDYTPVKNEKTVIKSKANNIVDFAKQFKGVRYKWGGTTKAGMDCSGLVFESYRAHDIYLPRISRDMAKKGKKIKLKDAKEGDLLFFKTKNRRNAINHVGLITKANSKGLEFIHATSSKGVIISKLSETYWNKAFVEVRSIL